jgi:hypothetical protein
VRVRRTNPVIPDMYTKSIHSLDSNSTLVVYKPSHLTILRQLFSKTALTTTGNNQLLITMAGLMHPSPYKIFPKTFLTKATRVLEVERKFLPTATSISILRANTGKPAFESFKPLGVSHTHDVYYDRNNALLSRGIYVRRRDENWEAKIRQVS